MFITKVEKENQSIKSIRQMVQLSNLKGPTLIYYFSPKSAQFIFNHCKMIKVHITEVLKNILKITKS